MAMNELKSEEYSHYHSPDEASDLLTAEIAIEIYKKSNIQYTPFIKIACLSNSDIN